MLERQRQAFVHESRPNGAVHTGAIERRIAFHRLADQRLDQCYRLATTVLGDEAEAQDAVHDAFVTAWRKYDTLRDPARFEAWFDRVVVNACRDRMRRRRRQWVKDLSEWKDTGAPDPTDPIADRIVVRRALNQLQADDRIVLALRFYRDMKVDDIADVMGINPRAASSRLHRAEERLRHILDDETPEAAR